MVHLIEQLQISEAAFLPDFLAYTQPFCLSAVSPSEQCQSSLPHSPGASFSGSSLFMAAEDALEVFPLHQCVPGVILSMSQPPLL